MINYYNAKNSINRSDSKKMKITPQFLKLGLNLYGPHFGAGIKVKHIFKDK